MVEIGLESTIDVTSLIDLYTHFDDEGKGDCQAGDSIALRVLRLLVNGRVKSEKISYKNLLKEIYTIRCICWANQIMRCFIVVAPTRHRPRDDDDSGRMTLNGDGVLSAFIL